MGETSSVWIIIPDLEGKQRTFAASKQSKEMIPVVPHKAVAEVSKIGNL